MSETTLRRKSGHVNNLDRRKSTQTVALARAYALDAVLMDLVMPHLGRVKSTKQLLAFSPGHANSGGQQLHGGSIAFPGHMSAVTLAHPT